MHGDELLSASVDRTRNQSLGHMHNGNAYGRTLKGHGDLVICMAGNTWRNLHAHGNAYGRTLEGHGDLVMCMAGNNTWRNLRLAASPLKWLLNGSSRAAPGLDSPLNEPDRYHDERTPGPSL